MAAVRVDAQTLPTADHARAAAEALQAEGTAMVLLHGSVARGDARPGSDVDLVAVFDDIDYTDRYPLRWRLEAKCSAAAGVPVEVHVTDRPEWKHRTEQVPSSFEAAIAVNALTLHERAPQTAAVDWGKEIGMPDSNLDEALERLNDVRQALGSMTAACRPRDDEIHMVDGHSQIDIPRREERLRSMCGYAAMTIENALKAWCAAKGAPSERTHSVARLLDFARPLPSSLENSLAPLQANTIRPSREPWDDVSCWRIGGTYPSALPQAASERMPGLARLLTVAAAAAADTATERVHADGADPEDERLDLCRQRLRDARTVLASGDVVAGIPPTPTAAPVVPAVGSVPLTDGNRRGWLRRMFGRRRLHWLRQELLQQQGSSRRGPRR